MLFDQDVHEPFGRQLVSCSPAYIDQLLLTISTLKPAGQNGGEARALELCLQMEPEAVVFLGDGGWESAPLLQAAAVAAGQGIPVVRCAWPLVTLHFTEAQLLIYSSHDLLALVGLSTRSISCQTLTWMALVEDWTVSRP